MENKYMEQDHKDSKNHIKQHTHLTIVLKVSLNTDPSIKKHMNESFGQRFAPSEHMVHVY